MKRLTLSLCAVLLYSALSVAPALAAQVEYVARGEISFFDPVNALPGIEIGTPIEASFVVDTRCSPPLEATFSNDADPVLVEAFNAPFFRQLHARIGPHELSSDRGSGQLFLFKQGDPPDTRMNLEANGATAVFADWRIIVQQLQYPAPIFRSDLDESELLASVLSFFTEHRLFDVQISGTTLGRYVFTPAEFQVRVLPDQPGPCQPQPSGRTQVEPFQALTADPSDGTIPLEFGSQITRHDNTALISEPVFNGSHGRVAVFTRKAKHKWVRSASIDAPKNNARFGIQMAVFNDFALIHSDTHAFLYRRVQGQWKLMQQLTPQSGYAFTEPTLWNNWAFIGATSATAGAVYVYEITPAGTLRGVQTLRSYSGNPHDRFGNHVAISNGRVLVSAQGDSDERGAAYVFESSGSLFVKRQKLTAINGAVRDQFAISVGISNDWMAIGASGVKGPQDAANCVSGRNTGAIYVFRRLNGVWLQQDTLLAADARDGTLPCVEKLGEQLKISGNWLVSADKREEFLAQTRFVPIIYKRDGTNFTPRANALVVYANPFFFPYLPIHLSNGMLFAGEPFPNGCHAAGGCFGSVVVYDLDNAGL